MSLAGIALLLSLNLFVFVLYGLDKRKAVEGQRRIPERILILAAILGGAPGAFLGMRVFHHKVRKPLFAIGVSVLLVLESVLFVFWILQSHNFTNF